MDKNISTTTPKSLGNLIKNGQTVQLIDVRTPAEYRECHVISAQNIPLNSLDPKTIVESKKVPKKLHSTLFVNLGTARKRHARSLI